MDEVKSEKFIIDRSKVERKVCRSRGKGGQHVNKTDTCVVLKHLPTGIQIRSEDSRSQQQNEDNAWIRLEEKLSEMHSKNQLKNTNEIRNNQIGSGTRNDKRRTVREQDGFVVDHLSGKQITTKEFYKGQIEKLHNK